jgi:nucleotide-binding universal stress UspA family protein
MNTPTQLDTILVGVDGSPNATHGLEWAAARAADADARIVAVHVLTYSTAFRRDLTLEDTITTWRLALQRDLDGAWTAPAREAGVEVRTLLVEADSAEEGLLDAVNSEHADLIVLGAKGRGSLADRLLGATTYKVAHRASIPVVVVPATSPTGTTHP